MVSISQVNETRVPNFFQFSHVVWNKLNHQIWNLFSDEEIFNRYKLKENSKWWFCKTSEWETRIPSDKLTVIWKMRMQPLTLLEKFFSGHFSCIVNGCIRIFHSFITCYCWTPITMKFTVICQPLASSFNYRGCFYKHLTAHDGQNILLLHTLELVSQFRLWERQYFYNIYIQQYFYHTNSKIHSGRSLFCLTPQRNTTHPKLQ